MMIYVYALGGENVEGMSKSKTHLVQLTKKNRSFHNWLMNENGLQVIKIYVLNSPIFASRKISLPFRQQNRFIKSIAAATLGAHFHLQSPISQ